MKYGIFEDNHLEDLLQNQALVRYRTCHQHYQYRYQPWDFVVPENQRRSMEPFFQEMGYEAHRQFNLLHGSKRQIFLDPNSERHVDIFVGTFEMCHKLPMNDRLHVHPVTVPLADFLLSKSQMVELNRKDALDIASILLFNGTGDNDDGRVNLQHIAKLCGAGLGSLQDHLDQLEARRRDRR